MENLNKHLSQPSMLSDPVLCTKPQVPHSFCPFRTQVLSSHILASSPWDPTLITVSSSGTLQVEMISSLKTGRSSSPLISWTKKFLLQPIAKCHWYF